MLLDAPGHLLRRAHQYSYEVFTRFVGADGPTRQQFALLLSILQRPATSQSRLSEITGIDRNTIAEMLVRLVEKGLVKRRRSALDSRAYELTVTAAGVRLLERITPLVSAAQAEMLATLPEALRPTFLMCLRQLIGVE